MAVHLEFIADDLQRLQAILGPLSSTDVVLEFTGGGDAYLSIDLREGDKPCVPISCPDVEPIVVVKRVPGADGPESTAVTFTELDECGAATGASVTVEAADEPEPESRPTRTDTYAPGTCGHAIIRLLDNAPDRVFSINDIVQGCPDFAAGTVKFTLSPLATKGLIRRVQPGRYQAI